MKEREPNSLHFHHVKNITYKLHTLYYQDGDDSQAASVAARLVQKALFCFRGHFPGFASRDKHFELPQEMSVYLA